MFLTAALLNRHVQVVRKRLSMKSSCRQVATHGLAKREVKTAFAPPFVTMQAQAIISRSNVSFRNQENGKNPAKKLPYHFAALKDRKSVTKTTSTQTCPLLE